MPQLASWRTTRCSQRAAIRELARAGKPEQVNQTWVYRFIKRVPPDLQLGPLKQRTKEYKRIQAEDTNLIDLLYDLLANLLQVVPHDYHITSMIVASG